MSDVGHQYCPHCKSVTRGKWQGDCSVNVNWNNSLPDEQVPANRYRCFSCQNTYDALAGGRYWGRDGEIY